LATAFGADEKTIFFYIYKLTSKFKANEIFAYEFARS